MNWLKLVDWKIMAFGNYFDMDVTRLEIICVVWVFELFFRIQYALLYRICLVYFKTEQNLFPLTPDMFFTMNDIFVN